MGMTSFEITASALNLRAGPDTSAVVVAVMRRGETALGSGVEQGGWMALAYQGRSGFAATAFLRPLGPAPLPKPLVPLVPLVPVTPAVPPATAALVNVDAKERDLAHLHPRFRRILSGVLAELVAKGRPFRIFEAYRQPERQAWLFAQGRTRAGSIVTKAEAWQSWHQYGVAADLVLFGPAGWSWETSGAQGAAWRDMKTIAEAAGLRTLSFERPHVELPLATVARHDGSLLADGDETWLAHMSLAAHRWRARGGSGAPGLPPDDGVDRPELSVLAEVDQATT